MPVWFPSPPVWGRPFLEKPIINCTLAQPAVRSGQSNDMTPNHIEPNQIISHHRISSWLRRGCLGACGLAAYLTAIISIIHHIQLTWHFIRRGEICSQWVRQYEIWLWWPGELLNQIKINPSETRRKRKLLITIVITSSFTLKQWAHGEPEDCWP